ncbi:MAG: type I restriction-modification system subunit M N-terminal domain-containing protein [Ilumatobacteraceae bacterium]
MLRDDGVSTIEYVEQLTYLLFLKMADERQRAGLGEVVPYGLDWQSLLDRDGDELETHYRHVLESLGRQPGTLGTIFRKAQSSPRRRAFSSRSRSTSAAKPSRPSADPSPPSTTWRMVVSGPPRWVFRGRRGRSGRGPRLTFGRLVACGGNTRPDRPSS